MGKTLALLKLRVTFPLASVEPAFIIHDILGWANGIYIVQIDAGKGGNYCFYLCLSVMWGSLHVV